MESTNKNIQKINEFIDLVNLNLNTDAIIDKEILKKDICIKIIRENKDFFSQITKEEAFYFVNNLGFADYKKNKSKVASKLILINQNFLPIKTSQDLLKIVGGFRLFKDNSKGNMIDLLIKSKKIDFFRDIDLGSLCQLLISDLKINSNIIKARILEAVDHQNPDLFKSVSSPIALLNLFEELKIDLDSEKYKLIDLILNRQKNIFSNINDIYDACSMLTELFKFNSDSTKYLLLKTIVDSNPQMLNQIESIDNFLQAMLDLRMGQDINSVCKICELLISDRPEILGSASNIEKIIQQVGLNLNEEKYALIFKALSLQKNKEDKVKLVKNSFKNFLFLSYQHNFGVDMIKECISDFDVDESANLINDVISDQSPWNKGELLLGIIFANVVRDKNIFLKIDLSDINDQDSQKIIYIARFRVKLTDFDLLKFGKLINCEKYSSIMDLLQKTGADGIFKTSKIHFINNAFNPDNDNDFDINKCKAINFVNYAQLMGFDMNLHKIFKSSYFKELGRSFVSRTREVPASSEDLMKIAQALRIRTSDHFIPLSNITAKFLDIANEINSVTVADVASLSVSQKAKDILEQVFKSPRAITQEQSAEFFQELIDSESSLDLSQDNRVKLFFFLRHSHKELCALLKSPEGIANLNNAIYSIADGCIANIGNQMKIIVLQELIKAKDLKNSQAILKIYQALIDGSIIPLINSDSDFIGSNEDIITDNQYMDFYHTAPTDFFRQVASKFNGSNEVHNILAKEMGNEKATQLMIKCGVCDEYLSEFDEEKAKLLGAYKAITAVLKKKDVKKIINYSDKQIKEFCSLIKDAEKSILESEQTPATTFAPLARLENLRLSATNFLQRLTNR